MRKLNLGCGNDLMYDYINIDMNKPIFRIDRSKYIFKRMNVFEICNLFQAGTVDEVTSHHFFEHLTHYEITTLLFKIWNVLKPGGKLEIIVPDFEWIVEQWKTKQVKEDFSDADILHFKIFSTEAETLHKSCWYKEIGIWYLTRENLFKIISVNRLEPTEIVFIAEKI